MADSKDGMDNERSSKRFRRDDNVDPTNPDPSMVIHVRNLSQKATEADLLEALSHFGTIAYATVMPNKRMALVEFEDIASAKSCVTYAQTNQIFVAGQSALFNYSTSKMIQRIGLESEKPNNVLILTIYNAQYPISVDIIYQICKPHGDVYRIALIRRTMLQALVEFDAVESARKAKYALNGADIYSGCCTLKVEFAKPDHVKVSRNDQDQWDYTVSGGAQQGGYDYSQYPTAGYQPNQMGPPSGGYGPPPTGGGYGQQSHMPMMGGYGAPPSMDHQGYGGGGAGGGGVQSSVVMVYGVDQEKINCDKLFNVLCLYGNVLRIKFMKSKPDTCMVQMGSNDQVQCAIENLHNYFLFGQKLALRPSKQQTLHDIRDPFDLPDGTPSFKDYTQSRNQRFNTPESAQRNRIVKPTTTLHWFNAPANMTEERMKEILSANDAPAPEKISIFPVKSERSSSGLAEFENVEKAMESLVKNNHTPVDSPLGKIPYIVKLAFASIRGGPGMAGAGGQRDDNNDYR